MKSRTQGKQIGQFYCEMFHCVVCLGKKGDLVVTFYGHVTGPYKCSCYHFKKSNVADIRQHKAGV